MKTIEIKIKKYSDIEYTCICSDKGTDIDVIKVLDDDGKDITNVIEWLGVMDEINERAFEEFMKSK